MAPHSVRRFAGSMLLVAVAAAVSGCSSAHATHDVGSGIYELNVRRESGSCGERAMGDMGPVAVVSRDGLLNVAVPGEEQLSRVSLSRASGLHAEVALAVEGCDSASIRRAWTVTSTTPSTFAVAFEEQWSNTASCGRRDLPAANCSEELSLEYRLVTLCAAPCELSVGDGGPVCVCAGGI